MSGATHSSTPAIQLKVGRDAAASGARRCARRGGALGARVLLVEQAAQRPRQAAGLRLGPLDARGIERHGVLLDAHARAWGPAFAAILPVGGSGGSIGHGYSIPHKWMLYNTLYRWYNNTIKSIGKQEERVAHA